MTTLQTIREIEQATEDMIKAIAEYTTEYKGYTVYIADLEGYYGYSKLVFKNGHHIHYTNDYELHHKDKTHEELKEMYLDGMKYNLFAPEDMNVVTDYKDYDRKYRWIMSYFPQEYDYESAFVIKGSEDDKRLTELLKSTTMYFSRLCCCYFYEIEPANKAIEMAKALTDAKNNTASNYEYWVSAFKYEMFNHEYIINWQGNWDVFSCFGNVKYKGDDLSSTDEIEDYCQQLGFTDMHRKAFKQAYKEYYEVAKDY